MGFHFDILDAGLIDYRECLSLQQKLSLEVSLGIRPSILILAEHHPVITLGRMSKKENILQPDEVSSLGIDIVSINRGGDVTLHQPGQLVMYPIFDLRRLSRDINLFLRNLEKTVILLLSDYGISSQAIAGSTGVWVEGKKIASLGIAIRRWVTSHGISLNVTGDLNLFSLIRPCGEDIMMTSMREILPGRIWEINKIKEAAVKRFKTVFLAGGVL